MTMYNRLSKQRRVALTIGLQHMVKGHTQPDNKMESASTNKREPREPKTCPDR